MRMITENRTRPETRERARERERERFSLFFSRSICQQIKRRSASLVWSEKQFTAVSLLVLGKSPFLCFCEHAPRPYPMNNQVEVRVVCLDSIWWDSLMLVYFLLLSMTALDSEWRFIRHQPAAGDERWSTSLLCIDLLLILSFLRARSVTGNLR